MQAHIKKRSLSAKSSKLMGLQMILAICYFSSFMPQSYYCMRGFIRARKPIVAILNNATFYV